MPTCAHCSNDWKKCYCDHELVEKLESSESKRPEEIKPSIEELRAKIKEIEDRYRRPK